MFIDPIDHTCGGACHTIFRGHWPFAFFSLKLEGYGALWFEDIKKIAFPFSLSYNVSLVGCLNKGEVILSGKGAL